MKKKFTPIIILNYRINFTSYFIVFKISIGLPGWRGETGIII